MVAYPGCAQQPQHSDVPPDTQHAIATLWVAPAPNLQDVYRLTRKPTYRWVALQDTPVALGATWVVPAPPAEVAKLLDWRAVAHAHEEAQARAAAFAATQRRAAWYSADGTSETSAFDADGPWFEVDEPPSPPQPGATSGAAAALPACVADLGLPVAVAVELAAGDVCLMDCRAFHCGGANVSAVPRALLSATFENEPAAPFAGHGPTGFTYELREDLAGRFVLGDFIRSVESEASLALY
jgi:ectoine hydroxylase-related dioxygenase (phytanoyl-CoA dioxygenase family)